MKKVYAIFSFITLIVLCLLSFSCGSAKSEDLTDIELSFVGTWELEDIAYTSIYPEKNQLRYPSESDKFNTLCEEYLGKTKIILNNSKYVGKISGTIVVGEEEKSFKWSGTESPKMIDLEGLSLSNFDGTIISKSNPEYAIKNSERDLWIYASNGVFMDSVVYMFRKI